LCSAGGIYVGPNSRKQSFFAGVAGSGKRIGHLGIHKGANYESCIDVQDLIKFISGLVLYY
jgi:hypothetical protein